MLTYDSALSTLQSLTGVQSTDLTNSATLIQFWNDSRRTVAGINGGKWPWLEMEDQALTVANQEYVQIPNHIRKIMGVRQQNGTNPTDVIYRPKLVFDSDRWDTILQQQFGSTNVPYFAYEREDKLYLQPIPSENGNVVFMRGRLKIRDINIVDYITGSIVSIANGATTVTGTGTSWTTSMAGRWLRITETVADNGGDGYWYEVASVTSSTILELKKKYQGTTISAGTALYRLGYITYEPETYQMAPIYRAVAQYWDFKENMVLSERYWMLYDGGQEIGKTQLAAGLIGQMLEEANESMEGPYLGPIPRAGDYGRPFPYYNPWLDATGF